MATQHIDSDESIQMLNRCKEQIIQMRNTISQLKPKAEAYDNISTILRLFFVNTQEGYGEDITWIIQKHIDELTPKLEPIQTPNMPFDLNKAHAPAKSAKIPIGDLSPTEINEIGRREKEMTTQNKFDPDPYSPKYPPTPEQSIDAE